MDVGSLEIKITYPIENAYVKEFQILGEGYYKKIDDKNDYLDDDEKRNDPKLSYDFYGLIIKGTLFFQ